MTDCINTQHTGQTARQQQIVRIVSHFCISHSNVKEILLFEWHCQLYIKTPFELQPEDGFVEKMKHVAVAIFWLYFNYNLWEKSCVRLKTYIQFIKYCELYNRTGKQRHTNTCCKLYNMMGKQRHKNTYRELYRVAWTKLGSPGVQHRLICRRFCSYLVLVCYLVVWISQVPACKILCMILQLVF